MIRHGQTTANANDVYSGAEDVPLTDLGRVQALKAQKIVSDLTPMPQKIIHSHLSRAKHTAEIINKYLDLPMQEIVNLGEQHFGDWQGQSTHDIRPLVNAMQDPPGGETHEQFQQRTKDGLNEALTHDDLVAIVCHGGIFRAFLRLYDKPDNNWIKNCEVYRFDPIDDASFPWQITLIE